jgi:Tetratricopeptide repeat
MKLCLLLVTSLFALFLIVGCGGTGDGTGLSPVSDFRRLQFDRALEGVEVVDGLIVAEPAPALSEPAIQTLMVEVDDLLFRGLRAPAIARAVAGVRGAPGHAGLLTSLGRTLLTTRRTEVALAAFSTAVSVDPSDADAHFHRGVALHRLGERGQAMAEWREVLALEPDHGEAHGRLAAASWLGSNPIEAHEHLLAAEVLGASVPTQLAAMIATGEAPTATFNHLDGAMADPVVGPQVRLNTTLGSTRANETSAAAGAQTEVVAGWNDYGSGAIRTGVAVSLDGDLWTDQVVRAPAANQADVEGDPMTARDPRTGMVWVGAIAFDTDGGAFVARKQPGADTFEPSVTTLVSSSADKGWMAAGPRPGMPGTTRLHLVYNLGLQYSDDLGDSWSSATPLGSGIGFLPRMGLDGTVYISYWNYTNLHMMKKTTDGGQTIATVGTVTTLLDEWDANDAPQIPGDFRVPQLATFAVDPVDGALFCVYFDTSSFIGGESDVDLWLTHSDDGGSNWTPPVVISEDPEPAGDQFFPWLEIDGEGRFHLLYLDTSLTVQSDAAPNAWIDAFYAWSDDRGATWSRHRLTASSFDSTVTDLGGGQFIGDYLGMAMTGNRVWPVYLSTEFGTPGLFSHEISSTWPIFADGFETGNTSEWSATIP